MTRLVTAASALLCLASTASAEGITVTRAGSQPVLLSPAEGFTGAVTTTDRFQRTAPSRIVAEREVGGTSGDDRAGPLIDRLVEGFIRSVAN